MSQAPSERRRYPRFTLACPITLTDETGRVTAFAQTIDVSDGGVLVVVPAEGAPAVNQVLGVELRMHTASSGGQAERTFQSKATVVRHQDVGQKGRIGIALRFLRPLKLDLHEQPT